MLFKQFKNDSKIIRDTSLLNTIWGNWSQTCGNAQHIKSSHVLFYSDASFVGTFNNSQDKHKWRVSLNKFLFLKLLSHFLFLWEIQERLQCIVGNLFIQRQSSCHPCFIYFYVPIFTTTGDLKQFMKNYLKGKFGSCDSDVVT